MVWGDRWLSLNHHRDPHLLPVEMNAIVLPEETIFCLLGLTFIRSMDWKPYIQSIIKPDSRIVSSLYRAQRFLTPLSILYLYKSTIQPCSADMGSQLSRLCAFYWFAGPVT